MVQNLISKKRNQPPALKHAKHKFSGLIACANCGTHHTFERQQDQHKEWRISSCKTRNYKDDFIKYDMCGNGGCKLYLIEKLFYTSLKVIENQLELYIDLVHKNKIADKDASKKKETLKKSMSLKIDHLKNKRKNIVSMLEDGFYEGDEIKEKKQETKMIQHQIKILEDELEQTKVLDEQSETHQIEWVLDNIRKFLTGENTMSEKEKNEILGEFIHDILYKKTKIGKTFDIQIEIVLKENIKEVYEEIKEELKMAI